MRKKFKIPPHKGTQLQIYTMIVDQSQSLYSLTIDGHLRRKLNAGFSSTIVGLLVHTTNLSLLPHAPLVSLSWTRGTTPETLWKLLKEWDLEQMIPYLQESRVKGRLIQLGKTLNCTKNLVLLKTCESSRTTEPFKGWCHQQFPWCH